MVGWKRQQGDTAPGEPGGGSAGLLALILTCTLAAALSGCDLFGPGLVAGGGGPDGGSDGSPGGGTDDPPVPAPGGVIVAVEGLSFVNTIAGELADATGTDPIQIEERDTYLSENLEALPDDRFEITSFRWSGNATGDTDEILQDSGEHSLRQYLRERKAYADQVGKPFIVVGHSWGTVLTYLALSMEAAEPDPLEVDLYVTLSTPLGTRYAHDSAYPEEAVITDYVDDWLNQLSFQTDTAHRPRAGAFYNYWAWGDLISGPLKSFVPAASGVVDVRVDEGMFDLPIPGSAYSSTLAYSNRNALDAAYWHRFTSANPVVLTDEYEDYLSQDFIRNPDVIYDRFVEHLVDRVREAAGLEPGYANKVLVTVSSVDVIYEDEGGFLSPNDYAEYFGYFYTYRDGSLYSIKRMRSENDYATLEQGDTYDVNWQTEVPLAAGAQSLKIEASLCEDELLSDDYDYPGIASVSIDVGPAGLANLPRSGSFDVSWQDADDEDNTIRVFYRVEGVSS